jgi:hypothetical protein
LSSTTSVSNAVTASSEHCTTKMASCNLALLVLILSLSKEYQKGHTGSWLQTQAKLSKKIQP